MVRQFYSFYARRPHISRILIKELYIDPKNSGRISNSFLRDIVKLEALIEAAKQRKELDPQTSVSEAVMLWWSYYSFILFQALQLPRFDVDEQLNLMGRLIDQHLDGIGQSV